MARQDTIAVSLFFICAPFVWIALGIVELQFHDLVTVYWIIFAAIFSVIIVYLMELGRLPAISRMRDQAFFM